MTPQPAHHHVPQEVHHHAAAARPLWTITRQDLDRRFVPGSDPVEEITVYFETRAGVTAWVTIPREVYTPEVVARTIAPVAEQLEEIAHMTADHHK